MKHSSVLLVSHSPLKTHSGIYDQTFLFVRNIIKLEILLLSMLKDFATITALPYTHICIKNHGLQINLDFFWWIGPCGVWTHSMSSGTDEDSVRLICLSRWYEHSRLEHRGIKSCCSCSNWAPPGTNSCTNKQLINKSTEARTVNRAFKIFFFSLKYFQNLNCIQILPNYFFI